MDTFLLLAFIVPITLSLLTVLVVFVSLWGAPERSRTARSMFSELLDALCRIVNGRGGQ